MAAINQYNADIEIPRLIRDILRGVDPSNVSNGYTTYVVHPDGATDQRSWILLERMEKNHPDVSVVTSTPESVEFNPLDYQTSTELDVDGACQIDIFVLGSDKPGTPVKKRNRKIKQDVTTQILQTLKTNIQTFKDKELNTFRWRKLTVDKDEVQEFHDVIIFEYGFT